MPAVLRAYAEGIQEHLLTFIDGDGFTTMVNHDLNGTFCVHFHLQTGGGLLIMEVAAIGVTIADINHYRACAQMSELGEPLPDPPRLFNYEDPNMLDNLESTLRRMLRCPDNQSFG